MIRDSAKAARERVLRACSCKVAMHTDQMLVFADSSVTNMPFNIRCGSRPALRDGTVAEGLSGFAKVTAGLLGAERHRLEPGDPHRHRRVGSEEVAYDAFGRRHPALQWVGDAEVGHSSLDGPRRRTGGLDLLEGGREAHRIPGELGGHRV